MDKNFDSWNDSKKKYQVLRANRFYKIRDIWWCNLGLNLGQEQDGTGTDFERPVLVVKAFSKEVCLIVPLTTSYKINPYYLDIGIINERKNYIISSQLRLVDTKRFSDKLGKLNSEQFNNVKEAIRNFFQ